MNNDYNKLIPYIEKYYALTCAKTMIEWDNATEAPTEASDNTAKAVAVLADAYYETINNETVAKLLEQLKSDKHLDPNQKAVVEAFAEEYDTLAPIPRKDYSKYKELVSRASLIWQNAKEKSDFTLFAPTLEEIIDYKKKFAQYKAKAIGSKKPLYDILLDEYEKGFSSEMIDEFFDKLKKAIIPLVKMVQEKNNAIDKSFNYRSYNIEKQREFSEFVAEYLGFDYSRGVIKESAHPFTTNFHNKDVRITTAYRENDLESAIFSTIHETGHALYEMHIDDALTMTPAGTGTSMGFHEGQSRMFENNIGRSKAFWTPLYDKLKSYFPEQLADITLDKFILGVNKAQPSLIRTDADELTYCLHIIVRYKIEKEIFNNNAKVSQLPKLWNDKYEEYLGIRPKNDSEGILQDIHWAGGDFGYFPSYAIGTAIAAQITEHLKSAIDLDSCLLKGDFKTINDYLKEKIHCYGKSKTTNELLENLMDEPFNPDYYIDYLTTKYTALYKNL